MVFLSFKNNLACYTVIEDDVGGCWVGEINSSKLKGGFFFLTNTMNIKSVCFYVGENLCIQDNRTQSHSVKNFANNVLNCTVINLHVV